MTATTVRRLAALFALLIAIAFSATQVLAQDAWQDFATNVEAQLDAPATSNDELERLRNQIVDYRAEFDAGRNAGAERIASLREQIAALGEPPAEGAEESEAPAIIASRKELESQLATLLEPVQVAEAGFRRADGLVGEIDTILRERQANELLTRTATPLNPALWGPALMVLKDAADALWPDGTDGVEEALAETPPWPLIIGATMLGVLLIARGRSWSTNLVERVRRRGAHGSTIWRFLLSLLRIILPLIGLSLLSFGALMTNLAGEALRAIIMILPAMGGLMLGFRWVSERVFSRDDDEALIQLSQQRRKAARLWVYVITLLMIAIIFLLQALNTQSADSATITVLTFPFTLLIAFALLRLSQILRSYGEETSEPDPEDLTRASTLARVVRGLGTLGMIVAVATPLLQVTGYNNAADGLLRPFVLTLALLGLVMALQRFSADIYGAVTGQGPQAREALMPVLFGMILLLLAFPVLALAWGARVADLTEIWARFSRGFAFGESRISPTDFIAFAVIFVIGYILTRLVQGALRSNVLPKTQIDIGGQNAIVSGLGYVGIFLAALTAIMGAGIDLSSLAIVAGALSVGIGFGLQNIVSNFVSGIILLIERPISEGDWIEVGGQMGYVRDISVRSTRIETFDRTDVIVPNADLVSGTVTNFTRGNTVGRVIIKVGVAYGTDTRMVENLLREISEAHPMVLSNPPPGILFMNFGADALEFEARCFLRDVNWMLSVKSDINHEIAKRFSEAGIEIPFAQRDLWLRNPETLKGDSTA